MDDIAIVLGDFFPEKVKEHYGDGREFNVKITYIYQGEPLGIAHAVGLCKDFVGDEKFVVHLGDDLIKGGIRSFVKEFESSDCDSMVLLCKVDKAQRFGVAQFDDNGNLLSLVEKPKTPPSDYALVGVYLLTPAAFNIIESLKPSWRGELEITEAIQGLLDQGRMVLYRFVKGWWKDTGTPEDILESNRLILDELQPETKERIGNNTSIQGRVTVGKNSVIEEGAIIRGPVAIGENARICSHAYIGPYTSIGNNVLIEQGEIENSIIMKNCRINIDGKITSSLIGPSSTITKNYKDKPRGYRFVISERSNIMI